jgi:hypothetical protein
MNAPKMPKEEQRKSTVKLRDVLYPKEAKEKKKRLSSLDEPPLDEPPSRKKRKVATEQSNNERNSVEAEVTESDSSSHQSAASKHALAESEEPRRRKSLRNNSSHVGSLTTDSAVRGPFTTTGSENTTIRVAEKSSSSSSSSTLPTPTRKPRKSPSSAYHPTDSGNTLELTTMISDRISDFQPSQGLSNLPIGPFSTLLSPERRAVNTSETSDSKSSRGLDKSPVGPFSSIIPPSTNSVAGNSSGIRESNSINLSTSISVETAPLLPVRRSLLRPRRISRRISPDRNPENSLHIEYDIDTLSHSMEARSFEVGELVSPVPLSEAEIAVEFARKSSAVMPTLPAGTLPLLSAMVFFVGVGLMAYMSLCHGHEECMDPSFMLASLGHIEGEGASEFFERARASVAPTADYVVEQLKQMWGKICAGELSQLSQLLTDKDIRVAVVMYLGAVIAICGGYFTITTMDCGNTFSNSYAQLVSSLKTSERLASVTERFEANSAAFTQWREATKSLMFGDDEDSSTAPTPPFSLSSFFGLFVRAYRWLVRGVKGSKAPSTSETEIQCNDDRPVNVRPVNVIRQPEVATVGTNTTASLGREVPSVSTNRLRNQFSIFHRARKPQILSFLQRLDVTAAILATLFLLLVLFLYHKTIKHFLSYCIVPCAISVTAFSAGRAAQLSYRWMRDRAALRMKQVAVSSAFAKDHLIRVRGGGPYPVDFLFEELKDLLADGTVESLGRVAPIRAITRASFGQPNYLSSPIRERDVDKSSYQEVDVEVFKGLWRDIVKEVLKDKRLLSVVMIFEGARRTCWKSLGAKNVPTPTRAPDPAPVSASIPTPNTEVKMRGVAGWVVFTAKVTYWVLSGSFRSVVFILRFLTRWV